MVAGTFLKLGAGYFLRKLMLLEGCLCLFLLLMILLFGNMRGGGVYSVKSGYRFGKELLFMDGQVDASSSCPLEIRNWKWIWNCCGPPRVQQFI